MRTVATPNSAQRTTRFRNRANKSNKQFDLYRIPDDLCDAIAASVRDSVVV